MATQVSPCQAAPASLRSTLAKSSIPSFLNRCCTQPHCRSQHKSTHSLLLLPCVACGGGALPPACGCWPARVLGRPGGTPAGCRQLLSRDQRCPLRLWQQCRKVRRSSRRWAACVLRRRCPCSATRRRCATKDRGSVRVVLLALHCRGIALPEAHSIGPGAQVGRLRCIPFVVRLPRACRGTGRGITR